ncbi:MAG TPA: hypothetical protein VLW17_11690 [Thermoanaerobaculaceae bacterium]|nr:hypothetical protein [Thermoanaerobaculaceae bacterium]
MNRQLVVALLLALPCSLALAQGPVEITSEPSHHLVLENDAVRVFAVTVNPGASTLVHRHAHDYIAVALGDSEILNTKAGAAPVKVAFKDGGVGFGAAGLVHAVADAGSGPFRNITVELLGPTTGERACSASCDVSPPCAAADKSTCPVVEELLTSDQWSVRRLTLPPGGHEARHTHAASYLVVPVTDADLRRTDASGAVVEAHVAAGQVSWSKPVTHEVTNVGAKPAVVVVLQFNAKPAAPR